MHACRPALTSSSFRHASALGFSSSCVWLLKERWQGARHLLQHDHAYAWSWRGDRLDQEPRARQQPHFVVLAGSAAGAAPMRELTACGLEQERRDVDARASVDLEHRALCGVAQQGRAVEQVNLGGCRCDGPPVHLAALDVDLAQIGCSASPDNDTRVPRRWHWRCR